MKYQIIILFITISSKVFVQECPPIDTLTINPIQDLWDIPTQNIWHEVEVMTWNIKQFPISNNTINYVNEIITDILPDIIAFQEINNTSAFNTLANTLPSYAFVSSGSGLALAARIDVIEIENWSTLFPSAGYDFAWRYPLLVDINWLCGSNAIPISIINIHLKSGSTSDDFNRRLSSSQYLSNYINDNQNTNIIIMGDYNDEITDSQNNNSLWPMLSNDNIAFATNSIANIDYYASYPSWPSFIDHIALSAPLFDELNTSNIQTIRIDDYIGYTNFQNNLSDHRPVLWSFSTIQVELTEGIVINEIFKNPSVVPDAVGEWIELTNISNENINLNGLILKDNDGETHTIADNNLVIQPGAYIVLGANNDPLLNGNINIDYQYSNFTLSNFWDEVIIAHPSGFILDEVYYDNGSTFPDEQGKSMMLIDPTIDNSIGVNWLDSNIMFGLGDFGTPGEINFSNDCTNNFGDMNGDNLHNVLDVVALVNCILANICENNDCDGDINQDGSYNVLDVVTLVNCILSNNCNN